MSADSMCDPPELPSGCFSLASPTPIVLSVGRSNASTITIDAGASLCISDPEMPNPSLSDLLAGAGDAELAMLQRYQAACEAAYELERELLNHVRELLPDFYWDAGDINAEECCLTFGAPKRLDAQRHITQECDRALRELGFTHAGTQQLGLRAADEEY